MAVASLFGCGGPADPARSGASAEGREQQAPERIVTLAPNLTEIAFAVGLGPRVVGVSDYVTWPPEAAERPHLGGLFDPNLERVIGLEPDLAITLPSQAEVATALERAGIPTLTVGVESVDDVGRAIRAVAVRCGAETRGNEVADRFLERLAPRSEAVRGPDGAPLRVAVSVDRAPGRTENLLVAGPGTYFHELLTRLGAVNVFADAPVRYPQVGMEEVLHRAPDAIIEIRPGPRSKSGPRSGPKSGPRSGSESGPRSGSESGPESEPESGSGSGSELGPGASETAVVERLLADWQRFPGLPAVERGAVTVIAADYALVPGPRLPLLYERLEAALLAEPAPLRRPPGS